MRQLTFILVIAISNLVIGQSINDSSCGFVLRSEFTELSKRVQHLESIPAVPNGFIYIQLPWQNQPSDLWPGVLWAEVTSKYSGHFFRALGGDSAPWETLQGENTPRLTRAESDMIGGSPETEIRSVELPIGGISQRLWTGDDRDGYSNLLATSFTTSGGEVRPKNLAIRIWQSL